MSGNKMQTLDEIVTIPIERYPTTYKMLDAIYGESIINGKLQMGFPQGKLSLWAAAPGVGKTRLATGIVVGLNYWDYTTLVEQGEVSASEYKGWIPCDVKNPKKFFISGETDLNEQIKSIKKVRPQIVICDSVNMIDDYQNSREIRNIMEDYKKTAQDVGCHVVFIAHLNKENTVKGNNDIEYLVDVSCKLYPYKDVKDHFVFEMGKNRYGKKGGWVVFRHGPKCVEYVASSADERFKGVVL